MCDAIAKSKENIFCTRLILILTMLFKISKTKPLIKTHFIAKVEELHKQREITNNVVRDINIFRFTILNKIDVTWNIVAKASALNKVVDFIETRLSRHSSRDMINEYQIFFEKSSNELYNIEAKTTQTG